MQTIQTISPSDLGKRLEDSSQETLILDVRTPAEYRDTHIEGSYLHSIESLDPQSVCELVGDSPCYVLCGSGIRAKKAIELLSPHGLENLTLIEGGITAWEQQGLPVNKGKKSMSLERQVRIAAGFLVALGAILGFTIHPYWHGLSAFVGCGLVFAGLTDTCGMAMVIAKMPWNR